MPFQGVSKGEKVFYVIYKYVSPPFENLVRDRLAGPNALDAPVFDQGIHPTLILIMSRIRNSIGRYKF